MSIHVQENLYRGVNAHLHSRLQSIASKRQSFHAEHIADLRRALEAQLPPNYYVLSEDSLQSLDAELIADNNILHSVMIYQSNEDSEEDIPLTRIELLSLSNKPPGSHYPQYRSKRDFTLKSGINLVEIDYLHERRSTVKMIPSYPDREANAVPYTVLVSNPHPSLEEGLTTIHRFRVDDPIPEVDIPLVDGDSIKLDLGKVYNTTFSQNRYYGLVAVDYEELPLRFTTYDEIDQQRIRDRMAAIAAEYKK